MPTLDLQTPTRNPVKSGAPVELAELPAVGPARSGVSPLQLCGLAALIWIALTAFYSLHANFPFAYHNDEPSKVRQIDLGLDRWNLRHPPLMLMVTEGIFRITGLERDGQTIARVGRATSAFFMAGAVAGIFLLAAQRLGAGLGLAVALLTASTPLMFECAHYFKEDAIFLFGIVALFFSIQLLNQRSLAGKSVLATCALLGVTAAWCVSSKYLGIVFFPLALIAVIALGKPGERWRAVGVFTLCALVTFCVLSLPLLLNWAKATTELQTEAIKLAEGDHGVGLETPHALFLLRLPVVIPSLLLLTVFGLPLVLLRRKFSRADFSLWLMLGFQVVYTISLCFVAKYSDRYLLPILLFAPYLAFVTIFCRWKNPTNFARADRPELWRVAVGLILIYTTLSATLPELIKRYTGFRTDSRAEMQAFIRENLPPDAHLAIDEMIHTTAEQIQGRQVQRSYFVADIGTMKQLHARGITHVAISYDVYYRYLTNQQAAVGAEDLHKHRSEVYRMIVEQGETLWQSPGFDPKPLHPGIRLVDIRAIPTDTETSYR